MIVSFTHCPPGAGQAQFEFFRGVTSVSHFKQMIDAMCEVANYYPSRPLHASL